LLDALSGEVPAANASAVMLDGQAIGALGTTGRRKAGLAAVPEERNGHAAVGAFTLWENAVLTGRNRLGLAGGGLIKTRAAKRFAGDVISAFTVKALGAEAAAGSLSGGNLQKYVMGREILQKPAVLIVDQPTWGVDAGAAAAIHQALTDLAAQGSAIVVISQDLDELLSLCDTLAVLNNGRLSPALDVGAASIQEIGLLMGGMHGAQTPQPHGDGLALPA
jgi:general nucleoside transport system ATP-binding protein